MAHRVYLSFGSNVGDRAGNLQAALDRIVQLGQILAVSSVYETAPIEFTEQPWFLNAAVFVETELSPVELISATLGIERDMGRRRDQSKGPRTIDIDILLFDGQVVSSPELTIPHPSMHARRFVLEPLAEIAGRVRHPVIGETIAQLLRELPAGQEVRRIEPRLRVSK